MADKFYFALGSKSAGRSAKTYEKWLFSDIFSCLGYYSPIFGQFIEYLLLKLHEMIRMSHVVEFLIVFIVLGNLGWHGKVLKCMKNAQL